MYSLLSASVLAIDLARHPSGVAVADVVDRVLALTPRELAGLHAPASPAVRERVLAACSDAPRMSTLMRGVAATVADGLPSVDVSRSIVAALSETMTGGLVDLLELLRREPPLHGADPDAAQVALDAVAAAWAGREADLADLAALRAPWSEGLDPVPPALPKASYDEALRSVLEEVSRRSPARWQLVADAHGAYRGALRWSTAMHEACRAAYDADRLVDVARAQLAAARALRLSGASTGVEAHAIAMAVTAAVQATCTADLIAPDVTVALLTPWQAGT
ncbi:MAG: hypothetical protein JWM02_847 [Frankiales bacterium]|nr:hypothetical protein [Frankiales bacterium]